jgi:hypothetical protein
MSRNAMDQAAGPSSPVLSAALLARICELNVDYIGLLLAERADATGSAQLQHLQPRVAAALALLPPDALRSLCAAPFSLYSLGFEDEGFWRVACEPRGQPLAQRYAGPSALPLQTRFCEVALLYAWHVASCSALAARMVYAMPDAIAARLASSPLWRLRRIAVEYPALLAPRWPTNPSFWPDLVRFAAANDAARLQMTQLLGNQLIAAELECVRTPSAPPPSPRLRARQAEIRRMIRR